MPAPKWFQKLRRRKKKPMQQPACSTQAAAAAVDAGAGAAAATTSAAVSGDNCLGSQRPSSLLSPNRASYYFASADRAPRQDRELPCVADMALDVRVDVVHRRAGERRLGGLDAPPGTPDLKLRPIVTRPNNALLLDASESGGFSSVSASATTSAATTPSTRARGFHVRPAAGGWRRHRRRRDHDGGASAKKKGKAAEEEVEEEASLLLLHDGATTTRRRRWLYESLVVVKASSDPEREMAESMAEMVVANGIRSSEDLEELLACYLALNAAEHHRAVVAAFRHVWSLLARHSLLL